MFYICTESKRDNIFNAIDHMSQFIGNQRGHLNNGHCYCAIIGLVRPRSLKLGLSYLKIEAHRAILS
jgi:hypothetical protein